MSREWKRVSIKHPCPICHKPDWCVVSSDGVVCVCMRVKSDKPTRNGGWLHLLRDNSTQRCKKTIRRTVTVQSSTPQHDFAAMAAQYAAAVQQEQLAALSQELCVSVKSLQRLGIGWAEDYGAWSFPMQNVGETIIGIRLRFPSGRKLSVKGGREGLFIPKGIRHGGPLLICEGPSDVAAMLDLGFNPIGRPSCSGGTKLLLDVVKWWKPGQAVILADADGPGRRGAERLAARLVLYVPDVRVIQPPNGIKDARAWKKAGATAADVQAMINSARIRKARIQRVYGGKYGR